MVGLRSKLKQLSSQKSEISKIRRKGENEYKKAKSLSRRYSSSLKSTQKRIETFKQSADDINEMLSQKISQMQSVQRCIICGCIICPISQFTSCIFIFR